MLKFLVFADFHYKKGMYAARVEHLNEILKRAHNENVDFVIHAGDLCNDYTRSPELISAYLSNPYNIDVFGVYGNHELEAENNSMQFITPLLSNQKLNFATSKDGYWYFDIKNYRLIGLDTNYSFNPTSNEWEHNHTRSHGAPKGNEKENSLSPAQLCWLDQTINDAKQKNMKAILFSHVGLCPWWETTPDAPSAREILKKYNSTVILAISGHIHSDDFKIWEDIPYFNVNASVNGCWLEEDNFHYSDNHTYVYDHYNENGTLLYSENKPLNSLTQGKNTWFFNSPLSAIVTINDDFSININGSTTTWMHDIAPTKLYSGCKPQISNIPTFFCRKLNK